MPKVSAEKYRDIDFSRAKRGAVIPLEPGKTKVSIRLDNAVLDYFRGVVEKACGGGYQSLINDALVAHVQQHSVLSLVRRVMREELRHGDVGGRVTTRSTRTRARTARAG